MTKDVLFFILYYVYMSRLFYSNEGRIKSIFSIMTVVDFVTAF